MHDWEADPRPYSECLQAWREAHDWSWAETARELRDPLTTVQRHLKGRYPSDTLQRRRLMTLIDQTTAG